MGLFEDAQREVQRAESEQRKKAAAASQAATSQSASNSLAISEFIDAMRRLGVAPQNHRYWTVKDGQCELLAGKVVGWLIDYPTGVFRPRAKTLLDGILPGGRYSMREMRQEFPRAPGSVVTPDGRVHQTRVSNKKGYYDQPIDPGTSDWSLELRRGVETVLKSRSH